MAAVAAMLATGGARAATTVYDLTPESWTPVNGSTVELSPETSFVITAEIPDGCQAVADAQAILTATQKNYKCPVTFEMVDGKLVGTASERILLGGLYTLDIPKGLWGDADFIAGDGGHANKAKKYTYIINYTPDAPIYDMTAEPYAVRLDPGKKYEILLKWSNCEVASWNPDVNPVLTDEDGNVMNIKMGKPYEKNDYTVAGWAIPVSAGLVPGKTYTLTCAQGGMGDMEAAYNAFRGGHLSVAVKITFNTEEILSVENAEPPVAAVIEDACLTGTFNAWAVGNEAYMMERNGNVYTYTFEEVLPRDTEFRIVGTDGSWSFGRAGYYHDVTPDKDVQCRLGGDNFTFGYVAFDDDNSVAGLTVEFTYVDGSAIEDSPVNSIVRFSYETCGVANVAADSGAAGAEYYNLQGVRVTDPAEGLYIRVSGGKATKVRL